MCFASIVVLHFQNATTKTWHSIIIKGRCVSAYTYIPCKSNCLVGKGCEAERNIKPCHILRIQEKLSKLMGQEREVEIDLNKF